MPFEYPSSELPAPQWSIIYMLGRILLAGLTAAMLVVLFITVIHGPGNRKQAAAATAAEIEREDIGVCTSLGAGPGTPAFAACVDGLTQIRKQHERRVAQDLYGIL